jgi:hypothetical protein
MHSLQSITTSTILNNIPINDSNLDAIENFLLGCVKARPSLLNKLLDKSMLYYVICRGQDEKIDFSSCYFNVIKIFASEETAIEWVKENGSKVIEDIERNAVEHFVITIIRVNNEFCSVISSGVGTLDTNLDMYEIWQKRYPTFTFSKSSYEMCLSEHKIAYKLRATNEIIPYWLIHFNGKTFEQGCKLDHIEDIHKIISYNFKQKDLDDYAAFIANPYSYIRNSELEFKKNISGR